MKKRFSLVGASLEATACWNVAQTAKSAVSRVAKPAGAAKLVAGGVFAQSAHLAVCAAQFFNRALGAFGLFACLAACPFLMAEENPLEVIGNYTPGQAKPIPVSLSGFSGEVDQVLRFDLYVVGFAFVGPESAHYQISGSNNGNVQGRVKDPHNSSTLLSKGYSGASLRRQAHALADDIVFAITGKKGIALTKIACKVLSSSASEGIGEIYVADFDGHNPQAVTRDGAIVAAPCWVPGRLALYYTSYKLHHADIFYHDLSTGARRVFARYGGSNMSPAPSPGGSEVAMILSKDGWTDLYVGSAGGGAPLRLTKTPQDESSPCWSPDGRWICYASKDRERRSLCKIAASGGPPVRIPTGGMPNPTEPDWSPDGKWIAFTSQAGGFSICVVPVGGGPATQLVEGEDPSWAPNSRTLIYARRQGGRYTLSLLDVPTKQIKDVSRISGSSNSQPSWAR
jgi:TolB protein